MGVNTNIISTIQTSMLRHGSDFMLFTDGVKSGMFGVSFHNSNASRLMSNGKDALLPASGSFDLASSTAAERAAFCSNLLSEMNSAAKQSQFLMELMAYGAQPGQMPATPETSGKNPTKAWAVRQESLKQKEKEDEQYNKIQTDFQKATAQLDSTLKALQEVNSDADIRFKNFKQAAESQLIRARKQYYGYQVNNPDKTERLPQANNKNSSNSKEDHSNKNSNDDIKPGASSGNALNLLTMHA